MTNNQDNKVNRSDLDGTVLGSELLVKYTPKKDLNRKAASYIKKHVTLKSIERFENCSSWLHFLTNKEMSVKRLHKTDACGNRFCPICTWKEAKKNAMKISIMMEAVRALEKKEFLFLTLTAPSVSGEDLRDQIDKFNKAVHLLFRRRNVERVVKGYIRKLEVTTDQEKFVTDELYERKKAYYDMRGIKVGDANRTYNTYHPHMHIIIVVNKSYFNSRDFISQAEWLRMWCECMGDKSITQVEAKKVSSSKSAKSGETGSSNAALEIAKYAAKGIDLYHSETVFDIFYRALKGRQIIVYSGMMKDYAKKYKVGELDQFKEVSDAEYTHMLESIWKKSKYESVLRQLSEVEFREFNELAKFIEEDDSIE